MEEGVASVLGQSYPQVELIVVDDGSTDGSTDILQRLAADHPERITLLYQNRNGPFAARNRALAHANGNYIAFLDADDTWQPDALACMHAALEAQPGRYRLLRLAAHRQRRHRHPAQHPARVRRRRSDPPLSASNPPWPINSVLIRRPLIDELRGFSERAPTAMDDDLWLRMLARQPRLVRVPEVLAFHRRLPHAATHTSRTGDRCSMPSPCAATSSAITLSLVARVTPAHLNGLIYDPLLREAYRCHWRNDTESARRLFRRAFRKADWKAGDLKHLVASLLPAPLYRSLVDFVTRRRSARIEG